MAQWFDDGVKRGGNRATFRLVPKVDEEATLKEGRPIFNMVEYVHIEVPADRTFDVDRQVRDDDRQNYRGQYEAFKAGQDQDSAGGTLLSATGLFPPARIEELAYFKVRTVEHYAAVSDANLPRMGMHTLAERQKCKDFIEMAKSKAPLLRMQSQIDSMTNERDVMKKQMADLQALADELRTSRARAARGESEDDETEDAPAPRKRGRPAKASVEAA